MYLTLHPESRIGFPGVGSPCVQTVRNIFSFLSKLFFLKIWQQHGRKLADALLVWGV